MEDTISLTRYINYTKKSSLYINNLSKRKLETYFTKAREALVKYYIFKSLQLFFINITFHKKSDIKITNCIS